MPGTPERAASDGAPATLFVITLTYTVPLDMIDALLPAHRAFLDRHFATGEFLASGPCVPRVGGVILASAPDRARIEEILAGDPFRQQQVATYQVTAFTPTRGPWAPYLATAGSPPVG